MRERAGPRADNNRIPEAKPNHAPRHLAIAAFLGAATFLVFSGVLHNGWILFDDPTYVFDNPHVKHGWTIRDAVWFLHEPHGGNWHPLTSYSHMLDVQLFGLAPGAHHATSLALHVLNALLLLYVLYRLTGAWWRSLLVAGFFALHPLRVESVAWISERKDVLSGLFFLATIEAYRRWAMRPSAFRWWLVLLILALGLMSKPMLVTLPFVLLLLDVWPLGRLERGPKAAVGAPLVKRPLGALILEKWPLFALAGASAIVTLLVQKKTGAVVPLGRLSTLRRVCNALVTYWRYIEDTLWPRDLTIFHPNNRVADVMGAVLAAVGLALVTWLTVRQLRSRGYLAVGWLWYLGMLVPVIGLVQVGSQAYADRYTYLPSIGLGIAIVWGVAELVSRSRTATVLASAAAVVALGTFSIATARQVALWRDSRTLFTQNLAVIENNALAHKYLGDVFVQADSVQFAIRHYQEALRLAPDYADARSKLGLALGALGRYDEAVAQLEQALRNGESAEIRHNLGFAHAKQGRIDEAITQFEAALRLDPDHVLALTHLGAALGAKNRLAEAEAHLRHALRLDPDQIEARRALAVTLTAEGGIEDAIREYGEILRRDPNDLDALVNIAWIRATHPDAAHRDGAEAVRLAERARSASPEPLAVVYSTLAAAYAEAGRFADAVQAGERAVELAKRSGQDQEAVRYATQVEYYRGGKPFHFEK